MSEEKLDIIISKMDNLATKEDIELAISVHIVSCTKKKNIDIAKISTAVVGALTMLAGAIYGLIEVLS